MIGVSDSGVVLAWIVATAAAATANAQTVVLYDQDFESPAGFSPTSLDVSQQSVNSLYGDQPPGFTFAQQFTVETLLIGGTASWGGAGFQDPSGIGGNYTLAMLSNVQADLLGLSFDVGDRDFLNVNMTISSIDLNNLGGPFVSTGAVPTFQYTLYDNPSGAANTSGNGVVLDQATRVATASAQNVLDWTEVLIPLDATGATNGNVTLQLDLLTGGYAAMDNFRIAASDTEGEIPEPGTAALLGLAALALTRRRRG